MMRRNLTRCPYCKEWVSYLWCDGFVSEPHNDLIADSVFHAVCWDKIIGYLPPQDPEYPDGPWYDEDLCF